jgi:hypothetical protein
MPLSPDNARDLAVARERWQQKLASHLQQSVLSAFERRAHFVSTGTIAGEGPDPVEVQRRIQAIVKDICACEGRTAS